MKTKSVSAMNRSTDSTNVAKGILLGLLLAAGTVVSVHAQGQLASGTTTGSGGGPYSYSLTFSNAATATSPIGSVWYAWIPGHFYLPGTPSGAAAPAGWAFNIFGDSIQFTASSPANYITAGQLLSGFSYQAAFSPAQLAAAPNSGQSDAYSAGLFSDSGNIFTVQIVPEPAPVALLASGAIGFCLIGWRKLRRS